MIYLALALIVLGAFASAVSVSYLLAIGHPWFAGLILLLMAGAQVPNRKPTP